MHGMAWHGMANAHVCHSYSLITTLGYDAKTPRKLPAFPFRPKPFSGEFRTNSIFNNKVVWQAGERDTILRTHWPAKRNPHLSPFRFEVVGKCIRYDGRRCLSKQEV